MKSLSPPLNCTCGKALVTHMCRVLPKVSRNYPIIFFVSLHVFKHDLEYSRKESPAIYNLHTIRELFNKSCFCFFLKSFFLYFFKFFVLLLHTKHNTLSCPIPSR